MASPSSPLGGSPPFDQEQDPLLEPGSFIDSQNDPSNADVAAPETPSWLPEGWKMITKVRGSGATAGLIDRYYVEPNSGRRLRSRKEVEHFLQTGTKRKRTIPPADGAADVQPLDFDFENVPEMTSWKLIDVPNDQWVPYIDGKLVSKSTKQGWDAAFRSLISDNSNPM